MSNIFLSLIFTLQICTPKTIKKFDLFYDKANLKNIEAMSAVVAYLFFENLGIVPWSSFWRSGQEITLSFYVMPLFLAVVLRALLNFSGLHGLKKGYTGNLCGQLPIVLKSSEFIFLK